MRRGVSYALCGTVAAGLVAATVVGWSFIDKSITVSVDGTISRKIHTLSLDVRGALRDAGYPLSAHDEVTPAADTSLREGTSIVLERGRLLDLDVDGKASQMWVAAATVGTALSTLGYAPDVYSSLPLQQQLPLTPTELRIRTVKSVTLVRAGVTDTVDSTAPSVGQLLADEGISPGPHDKLSVPASTALSNGMMIVWQRVIHQTVVQNQQIDFDTTYRSDASMRKGTSRVATPGQMGTIAVSYDVMTVDGKQVAKTQVATSMVVQPVDEVVLVGTAVPKPATHTSAPPTPTSRPAASTTAPTTPAPTSSPVPAKPAVTSGPRPTPTTTKPSPKPSPKPSTVVTSPRPAPKPKPVSKPVAAPTTKPLSQPKPSPITTVIVVTPGSSQALARQMLPQWGWGDAQFSCLKIMWTNESGWRVDALNPSSGAYGIPQALPANKMATSGADWRTNPRTQIRWGLDYIKGRYGSPCTAWSFWQAHHWY
jgi:resuscitation-promoting factor RpfB